MWFLAFPKFIKNVLLSLALYNDMFYYQDLAALPEKDKTPMAEGGLNLSGGQKARVALARYVTHFLTCT